METGKFMGTKIDEGMSGALQWELTSKIELKAALNFSSFVQSRISERKCFDMFNVMADF